MGSPDEPSQGDDFAILITSTLHCSCLSFLLWWF